MFSFVFWITTLWTEWEAYFPLTFFTNLTTGVFIYLSQPTYQETISVFSPSSHLFLFSLPCVSVKQNYEAPEIYRILPFEMVRICTTKPASLHPAYISLDKVSKDTCVHRNTLRLIQRNV